MRVSRQGSLKLREKENATAAKSTADAAAVAAAADATAGAARCAVRCSLPLPLLLPEPPLVGNTAEQIVAAGTSGQP